MTIFKEIQVEEKEEEITKQDTMGARETASFT